jgi:peptide/nickel transport system substrate-binding protein
VQPKQGGVFTAAHQQALQDFNGVNYAGAQYPIIRALYDTPVRLDDDLNPKPELAQSWQFSPDGRALTVDLRPNVTFHSGREMTAEDVKASWEFAKETSPQLKNLFSLVRAVETPKKLVATFVFESPCPLVFDILDSLSIQDKTAVGNLSQRDAGCGPFTVVSYQPRSEVRMKRFDGYWQKGKPFVEEYVLKDIPDPAALVLNLESKAIDAAERPPLNEVARLKGHAKLVADPGPPAPLMLHLGANVERGPLSNKLVRQAINFAIDRERVCRTIFSSMAEHTCLMWPKGSWAYFADLEGRYKYDLEKAKTLLAQAGLASGFQTTILTSRAQKASLFGLAQIVQGDLAKLGIKAEIQNVESTLYNTRLRKGDFDLCTQFYGQASRDPGTMLAGAIAWYPKSQGGPYMFESPSFKAWRDEAVTTIDREKRKALYRKVQEWVLEESFSMAVTGEQTFWLYWDHVKGVWYSREGSPIVADFWLDK